MTLDEIERRGRALAAFCRRVRERGGVAEVEELEDLPVLQALYVVALAAERRTRARVR